MTNRLASYMIFALAVFMAGFISLGVAFTVTPLTSDTAEMAIITHGIQTYGPSWLENWVFPPDNQLLTLLPFAFLFYHLAGISLSTIVVQGWLIFFVNAMLTTLIVGYITQSIYAATVTAVLALLANPQTIGGVAMLAFPITHNIAWTFALLATWLLLKRLSGTRKYSMLIAVLTIAGVVSDPWFFAAFLAPAMFLVWKHEKWGLEARGDPSKLLWILLSSFMIGEMANLFLHHAGVMLPNGDPIAPPALFIKHIPLLLRGVLLLFTGTANLPSGYHLLLVLTLILSALIIAVLLIKCRTFLSTRHKLAILFFTLSIASISVAYVTTGFAIDIGSTRFLINIFYSAIALFVIAAFDTGFVRWRSRFRWKAANYAITSALLSYVSITTISIANVPLHYQADGNVARYEYGLSRFLVQHKLAYGYGPYFNGVNTLLLDALSKSLITAVPVNCNMGLIEPFFGGGGNNRWVNKDADANASRQFFVFRNGAQRYESCAQRNLGDPSVIYHYSDFDIYVYDRNLMPDMLHNEITQRQMWEANNIKKNRNGIVKVCKALDINDRGIQDAYTWLLVHGLAT